MKQKSLKQLIEIVKMGSSLEVKTAQKEIEKRYKKLKYPLTKSQNKEYEIFLKEIEGFDQIKSIDNKMYFINTLKWPFLVIGKDNFSIFADFIIQQIQNPAGKIRQTIINSVDWLLIATTFDLEPIFDNPTKEQLGEIHQNKERFYFLTFQVIKLLDKYNEPRFNKYKYVSSMPPSIYKSLQILITEHLMPTEHQKKVYEECQRENSAQNFLADPEFSARRLEIEKELTELLQEHKSSYSLEDIKEIIYNEKDHDDFMKVVQIFDRGGDASELQNILDLATDAWNYFPHQILGGLSPMEIIDKDNPA